VKGLQGKSHSRKKKSELATIGEKVKVGLRGTRSQGGEWKKEKNGFVSKGRLKKKNKKKERLFLF